MGTPGEEEEMVKAEVRHQGDLREPELLSTMVYADARQSSSSIVTRVWYFPATGNTHWVAEGNRNSFSYHSGG